MQKACSRNDRWMSSASNTLRNKARNRVLSPKSHRLLQLRIKLGRTDLSGLTLVDVPVRRSDTLKDGLLEKGWKQLKGSDGCLFN